MKLPSACHKGIRGSVLATASFVLNVTNRSRQHHDKAILPPGQEPPGIHLIGRWVGPRAGMDHLIYIYKTIFSVKELEL
jgi:hypothetical protein